MRTFMICKREHKLEISEKFKEYDTRSNYEVVEYFIKEFTQSGDTVLDMFAGMGTTLIVAEKLNRVPYGVSYLEDKYKYVISKIENKENMIHGDARRLLEYEFPPIDFVYTSPIFMSKNETRDHLNGYEVFERSCVMRDFFQIYNRFVFFALVTENPISFEVGHMFH